MTEDLKNLAIVVGVIALFWWWHNRKRGGACCAGCATAGKTLPVIGTPPSAAGLRASSGLGCGPFACGR